MPAEAVEDIKQKPVRNLSSKKHTKEAFISFFSIFMDHNLIIDTNQCLVDKSCDSSYISTT